MPEESLLTVQNLKKYFEIGKKAFSKTRQYLYAVDDISFCLKKRETLGLVGESGCGKTTAGRVILRLIEPTDGKVVFDGIDVFKLDKKQMQFLRKDMQIIFQDPYSSLDPRMTVEQVVGEPLEVYHFSKGSEKKDRIERILKKVGLKSEHLRCYPSEFSGGQRQRIGIARALILNPKLIIADEPVSSLDVSIQAQVINLLDDLKSEFDLSYIMISHDLGVVKYLSDRVAVMYLGKIVEIAECIELYDNPRHPYTEALLAAIPVANPLEKKKRIILRGDVSKPIEHFTGCAFYKRCPHKEAFCAKEPPQLKQIKEDHFVSCHRR